MGTHKCVLVQLSETRMRCLHSNDAVSNDMLHALHSMHLSGEQPGHPFHSCIYTTSTSARLILGIICICALTICELKVRNIIPLLHIARTLHGNESMQLPRRGKNIARHMSSPFDISSSRRVHPSIQTKLSMNGSRTSVRPTRKNLPPTAITFFRSKCLLAQERAGERRAREPPAPNV